jgi:hypothetical protein
LNKVALDEEGGLKEKSRNRANKLLESEIPRHHQRLGQHAAARPRALAEQFKIRTKELLKTKKHKREQEVGGASIGGE